MSEEARANLKRITSERRESLAALSRLIGRNDAYLQQFVTRGSPARLDEQDRATLARYFGVSEALLGGAVERAVAADMVRVARRPVEASAGPGSLVGAEAGSGGLWFERAYLRRLAAAEPGDLSIISATGDSMAPTLHDGDDLLVDQSEAGRRVRDGIFILRRDESLIVKRVAIGLSARTITIASDNPAYPTWTECPLAEVAVVGRVVWVGHRIA